MSRFFAILAIAVALLAINADAQCVNMPNAYKYSVLATTTVTNSGASRFTGWFGIGSGSYTGLTAENVDTRVPEGLQLGTSSNPALSTALSEMQSTYNSIAALTFTELTTSTVGASTELGGRTLAPGNYRVSGNAILNGQLRLTTSGSYNFYIVGTLNVAAGATVTQDQSQSNACVTWAVQEQVNINNNAQVFGFIISRNTVSLSAGTIVTGGVASYTEVSAQTATVTNSGVNCCSGGSTPTTVYAWVLTSVNQCSTFGQTALCNTAGTATANYQCASASSSNLFYTVQASNANCLGSSLSVICLSSGTSGTQVACSLPQVISGSPNSVISPVTTVPTQTFGCYTPCQAATTTYAWVFNGFSQCTQACGTSATVQGSFSCYSTTSQSGGVYSLSTSASCTNAGAQLNVICLASSGSNLSVGCSTVYGTDANLLPQFVQAFATPSASKTCPVVTCPEQTNNNPGSWCVGEFGACSATCGANGVQTRQVTCVSPTDGSPMPDSQCLVDGTQPKPVSVQQCNTNVVCPCHTWIVSSWGGCSGCRGTQTRTVTCVLISDTSVVIPDNQCQAIMSRPASTQTCNSQDASCIRYQWVYGNYGACFPSCGTQRTQTRSRTCYGSTNPLSPVITLNSITGLPSNDAFAFVARDADCAGLADAGTTLTCPVISCGTVTYSWAADNVWSGCSINNCGGGIETRRAWCVSSATSAIAQDALCTGAKPATSRACNTNPCPAYHYVAGSWSACSATCGKGYRQRSVACYAGSYTTNGQLNSNIDMTQPVAMSFCQNQPVPVPVTFEECTAGTACSVAYNWFAGAWSGCSATCGSGTQTRSVTCWSAEFDQRDPVNEALCVAAQRPASQQSCNTAPCQQYVWDNPAWGTCSCETRQQTRTPRCYPRLPNGQPNMAVAAVADSFCAGQTDPVNPNLPCPWALAKPVSQQNCVPSGCTDYYWWAGTWGSCMNSNNQETFCGGGTRTRAVLCYSYADDMPVASSFCTGATPTYAASEPCNTQACTFFQWKESPWCSCTKQCGGGVRTKSVQCYAQPENVPVPDSYCATANPPLSSFVLSEACNTAPCTSYVWLTTAWTTCNKDCGCGRQTRSVYCVPSNNQVVSAAVSDDKCQFVLGGKPASYAACNTAPCPPVYFWAVTPWQACSKSCGTDGIQQRAVNCYWSDLPDTTCQTNRWLVSPTSPLYANCPSPPPRSTRPCNRQVCVSYAWYWSEWSQCSVTCGGGTRTRNVACYASNDSSNYVADSLCPNGLGQRPSFSESCNTQACDNYIWIAEPWSTCSATCGGGTSTRTVQCYAASDKTVPVSDAFCNAVAAGSSATTGSRTPKPATTMVCNSCACAPSYQYYYDQWSQCSATCGGGTQTRFAGCFASDNPNQILQDTACVGLTKAATTQPCNTQACQTYYWGTGAWSACPAVCPTSVGTQTRTVQCFGTASSTPLSDEAPCLAAAGIKPSTTQSCSTECRSCAWQYTTASLCSKSCNGVMYRKAQCICTGSDSTPQDASLCAGQQQDPAQMAAIPCNVNPVADCANTNYQWFTGNPGACSATCGTGTSCRVVYCYNTFDLTMAPVADSFCSNLIGGKPAEQQSCQLTACPVYDWQLLPGSCPVTCGGGYTVNTVQCRVVLGTGVFGNVVSEANCNAATKPVTSSICNTIPCSYISSFQWVIGTPGTCSKTCGEGIAYREVRCIDTLTSLRAQDSSCTAALGANSKPSESIACNVGQSTINCPNNYCLSTRDNVWSCFATDRSLQVESTFCQWATGFIVPTSGSSAATSSWMVGPWSACAGGSRSRSVTCWSSTPLTTGGTGFTYQANNCNEAARPSTTGSC